jgi:hypothetical protein
MDGVDDDLPPLRAYEVTSTNTNTNPTTASTRIRVEEQACMLEIETKEDKSLMTLDKNSNTDPGANSTNTSSKRNKKKKKSTKQKDYYSTTTTTTNIKAVTTNTSPFNNKEMLNLMYENLIGRGNKLVNPLFLSAVRNNLSHKSGEEQVTN